MDRPDEPSFSIEDLVVVQHEMRSVLGLPEERFSLPSFIGMLSDEIEQMRSFGISDEVIAQTIMGATGEIVTVDQVQQHYAPPEQRKGSL
jgi:hypothetical protein